VVLALRYLLVGSQIPINHYLSGKNVFSIKRLEEGTHLLYPYLGPISVDIPDIVRIIFKK
jgi:hypothetical protein